MDDGAYLFSYKFGGGNAKMFLELAGEVLGIFETEEVRGLADGFAIIGATKERHVVEAAEAAKIQLTAEEISKLEALADATGIDTRGGWEHSME